MYFWFYDKSKRAQGRHSMCGFVIRKLSSHRVSMVKRHLLRGDFVPALKEKPRTSCTPLVAC